MIGKWDNVFDKSRSLVDEAIQQIFIFHHSFPFAPLFTWSNVCFPGVDIGTPFHSENNSHLDTMNYIIMLWMMMVFSLPSFTASSGIFLIANMITSFLCLKLLTHCPRDKIQCLHSGVLGSSWSESAVSVFSLDFYSKCWL